MKILPSKIDGEVAIPSSKSFLHRELILSALANEKTEIVACGFGDDITRTIDCLNLLGAKIIVKDNLIEVNPITKLNDNVTLNAGESGSTLRFIIPLLSALNVKATITGSEGILSRPISPIVSLLKDNGVKFSSDKLPLTISGKLTSNNLVVDGSLSSQFATGLLISLAKMGGGALTIKNAVSVSYLDITAKCLKNFGVNVTKTTSSNDIIFKVEKGKITSPKKLVTEGDCSSADFMLALGTINGKVILKNVNLSSVQGDKIFVKILKEMGANIEEKNGEIVATKSALKGTVISVKNCPDLAPILSVVMGLATGESIIEDTDRLTIKESNRLDNIINMLTSLGIKASKGENQIKINGGRFNSASLKACNDHRIAISSIIALSVVGGQIDDTKCINKSYPQFLKDFKNLGGQYEI